MELSDYKARRNAPRHRMIYPGNGKNWHRVTDTCSWAEGRNTVAAPGQEALIGGQGTNYSLCGRAALLLIAR